tara:strand:- start:412 stop:918 length:507 start_codon:yes stop_codon:yes gene_type:complete
MLIDNIGNICGGLYNNILNLKKKLKGGNNKNTVSPTTICSEISEIYKNFDDFNKDKFVDFKNNVNSKYFKDQVITCLRKHASDTDNIDSLQKVICNNNIYNTIKNLYKLPENIILIKNYLFVINILIFFIFSINFIFILAYMKVYSMVSVIIFAILIFILILLAFLII